MGWASKSNGELLALASVEFDVFLTSDRNLSHQQNLSAFDIAVIVLIAASNRINDLRPLVPRILEALVTEGGNGYVCGRVIPGECELRAAAKRNGMSQPDESFRREDLRKGLRSVLEQTIEDRVER